MNMYKDHPEVDDQLFDTIKARCLKAKELAYCPYSNFRVGCTVLSTTGEFFDGANVENASHGAGICAERTTIAKAVTSGCHQFKLIAISADTDEVITPCGICRQVIREFTHQEGLQLPVYMFNKDGSVFVKMYLNDLLPLSFGPEALLQKAVKK